MRILTGMGLTGVKKTRTALLLTFAILLAVASIASGALAQAQQPTPPAGSKPTPTTVPDTDGPTTDSGPIVIPKKEEGAEPPPPTAPAEQKIKNPSGLENYSIRVDVPIVNVDVSVILDKTHQFVPGLQPFHFRVLEDNVEQKVSDVHIVKTPITAVMLLEFASNNYSFIRDMQNSSAAFFRSLQKDDYIAVITYDLRTRILTDFTQNKDVVFDALRSLVMPGFSDTNLFDALYETLDRVSRIEGREYIILLSTGRDTFSRITLDKILAKIKATPNVTIFAVGTGQMAREMSDAGGGMGPISRMNYLQADNQMRTFATMTGGLAFFPMFQGALPDIFGQINDSIRNQYVVSYHPLNTRQDGTYRKLKVQLVDREGRPLQMTDEKGKPQKYSVIARDGYKARQEVE